MFHFKFPISNLKFLAFVLCCFCLSISATLAEELRLRDGTVIKADAVWERDNLVWYQQGQIIRSLPLSEVVRAAEIAKATNEQPATNPYSNARHSGYK